MASSSADAESSEFNVMVLEIMYNLLKHINPKDAFLCDAKRKGDNTEKASKLSLLLEEENAHKRAKSHNESTRHNRFGGSYTLQGWDGSRHVILNQKALHSSNSELINEKKKPDRRGQKRKERDEIGEYIAYRDPQALIYMKQMAQSFLESCFNAFYLSLIKDMEREDKKIMEKDHIRLYFTMRWFLEYLAYEHAAYNNAKERKEKEKHKVISNSSDLFMPSRANSSTTGGEMSNPGSETCDELVPFDYDLVASAMDLRTFLLCLRRLRVSLEDKLWMDVQVGADCFKQMLLTLTAMATSPHEEYRQLADYIQGNIYHEQSTLDLFTDLIKRYKNQSNGGDFDDDSDDEESAEDRREQQLAYREHVFKFESLEAKYATGDVVRIYCTLLENYRTLKPEILVCITTLFHRIMVKRKVEKLFFKLTVLDLFNRILNEYPYLPKSPAMSQLVQFIRYSIGRFFKRANEYPLLFVEVLFKSTAVGSHFEEPEIDGRVSDASDNENDLPPSQQGHPEEPKSPENQFPDEFMLTD
ncbi:Topoisomerase 1-associated factor 1 [Apophysomyces sp. BC1034]|nr:Topoisomerase 1-associated factor 1 [Apophysomyces sp. BC1021]KAG0194735.1 Topoisomerase 1-associated factor 1 [Apophysomyces sp. BC1034]